MPRPVEDRYFEGTFEACDRVGDGGGDPMERTGGGREGAGAIDGIEDFELIERVADWSGHGASVASQCSALTDDRAKLEVLNRSLDGAIHAH